MGAPQYEQAGADVAGSGTTGTIPVWSSGTTLGDSIIKQSSGATSVGVGVTPLTSLTGYKSIEVGVVGSGFLAGNNDAYVTANAAFYSGGWKYAASAAANAISFTSGITKFLYASAGGAGGALSWSESARIDSSGALLVGTQTNPLSPNTKLMVSDANNGKGFEFRPGATGTVLVYDRTGGTFLPTDWQSTTFRLSQTAATFDASTAGAGLKLPATPGNADTQTLDCYQETTWAPTLTGFGGTNPTVSTRVTRVGRLVTLNVQLSATGGAQFSSTAGSTYLSLPAGMTPALSAAGGASDAGIGALNPCVAFTNGNLYVPTFALRTTDTFLTVTYAV